MFFFIIKIEYRKFPCMFPALEKQNVTGKICNFNNIHTHVQWREKEEKLNYFTTKFTQKYLKG